MVLAESRQLVARNRELLQASARRTALFWERRRVPWPKIFGGADDEPPPPPRERLEKLRRCLQQGELPSLVDRLVWAANAKGDRTCVVCGSLIRRGDIEYEPRRMVSNRPGYFTHVSCFNLWVVASGHLHVE